MLHRLIALFAIAVALVLGVSQSSAQPGKGGFGKGGGGPKQLEAEIAQLREQVKELEAKLSKTQGGSRKDEKGPAFGGPFGKGPGGFGPGGFGKGFGPGGGPLANLDPEKLKRVLQIYELAYGSPKQEPEKGFGKKDDFKKKFDFKKGDFPKDFGKDKKKEFGKGPTPPTPPTPPMPPFGKGKGKGPGGSGASSSVDARIDRLIGELEQLRRDLKKK